MTLSPITCVGLAKRDWLTFMARHPDASKEDIWDKLDAAGHRRQYIWEALRELLREGQIVFDDASLTDLRLPAHARR